MLRPRSVQQLLDVLTIYRRSHRQGEPRAKSVHEAIQQVAKRYGLRYQTIEDGCRRRLNLKNIDEFHKLLKNWDEGDPGPLAAVIRKNSERDSHLPISDFFTPSSSLPSPKPVVTKLKKTEQVETIPVKLSNEEVVKLDLLASIAGISPSDLAARFLSQIIGEKVSRLRDVI